MSQAATFEPTSFSPPLHKKPPNKRRAHRPIPERVDIAIVGGGLGGLVSAGYLAKQGFKVALFESHYTLGGCATQFSRGPKHERYHFDVGLHYIGDCGPEGTIPRILRELDTAVSYAPMDGSGFDTLVFPDFRFRVPANLDLYRQRLLERFPSEKRAIDGYVKLVGSVMKLGRLMDVNEGRRPPIAALAKVALDGLRVRPHLNATMADVLTSLSASKELGAVLLGQSGDYGLPPSQVSALLHMGLAGHYFHGAYYPHGGGQVIADRIAERLEALGVSLHVRAQVERIAIENGRVVGLDLAAKAGEPAKRVQARCVISNADLKRTLLELVGPAHLPSSWVQRAQDFKLAAALMMTFVGLKGTPQEFGMKNTNVWQFDGYDVEHFYENANRPSGPIELAGCYITSASLKDPTHALHHAPAGHIGMEIMGIVPASRQRWGLGPQTGAWDYKHEAAYLERKNALEAQLIDRLEQVYPGTKERVVFQETATPRTHERFTQAADGTVYGIAATVDQFMKARPGYRGPVDGLYFAGASTRAGHGIVGAMMSGRACAGRVIRDQLVTPSTAFVTEKSAF